MKMWRTIKAVSRRLEQFQISQKDHLMVEGGFEFIFKKLSRIGRQSLGWVYTSELKSWFNQFGDVSKLVVSITFGNTSRP